jgi:uncharacterized protein
MLDVDSLHKLKSLQAEFTADGIAALYLFGSQARGDATPESDYDIAFDVRDDANERFSLVDQARLQIRLQELMGRKVDFFERRALLRRFGPKLDPLVKLFSADRITTGSNLSCEQLLICGVG